MSQAIDRIYLHAAERAGRLANESHRITSNEHEVRPIIAIAGLHGAQREEVAAKVAEALDFDYLNGQVLERIAKRADVPVERVAWLDERRINMVTETVAAFDPEPHFQAAEYRAELGLVMREIIAEGNAVVVGHGGRYFLGARPGLRVYVTAPLQERIEAVAQQTGLDPSKAEAQVRLVDGERAHFLRDYLDADPEHPELSSDLVLNVGLLGVEGAVNAILAAYAARFPTGRRTEV
ncbi:MAG: cytidylate kinase-like family protein [Myxococcales bacterium]|nr:cytidylate kinase-like family protein [Myxococcales bacterium]